MSDIKIFRAAASLDDMNALDTLLAPIRKGELLRASLLNRESGRMQGYDEETQTACCIVSDGKIAVCFTVTGVSLQQTAEIMAECNLIEEWSFSAFQGAVERALGGKADRIN